jgi:hypothetical protein
MGVGDPPCANTIIKKKKNSKCVNDALQTNTYKATRRPLEISEDFSFSKLWRKILQALHCLCILTIL